MPAGDARFRRTRGGNSDKTARHLAVHLEERQDMVAIHFNPQSKPGGKV